MSRETKGAMSLLRLPSGERFYLGKVWIERNINKAIDIYGQIKHICVSL